jgi:hypothetical protein
VSFTAITLCVASQRVIVVVVVVSLSTPSGNFWIHPRTNQIGAGQLPFRFGLIQYHCPGVRDSSVGIASRLRAGRSGFDSRRGLGIFLFIAASIRALRPIQPPV